MNRASCLIAASALAVMLSSGTAHANGRFPESNQIVFAAHDPDLVLLRVTFGLLVSHDRGRTFEWVCEQSIGFSGIEDPMYAVTPSSTYVATTFQGVTITRDQGCGWTYAGGDLTGQVFIDLASDPNDPKHIVTFASSYDHGDDDGGVFFTSNVFETRDEGQSFQRLGPPLDTGLLGHTVDLTKTDPNRIYITAVRSPGPAPRPFLLTSKDYGKTWEELSIPLQGKERAVYIAAVDPTNAERVYLRTSAQPGEPTRLLVREAGADGGQPTVRTIYTAKSALLGFALTDDGSKMYIGGPKDGLLVADTQSYAFQQRSSIEIQCLGINGEGLWACSNELSGFVAGVSKDDGATFEPRLKFCDIRGPLTCPAGAQTSVRCPPAWDPQRVVLGCVAPKPGADAGFDAGTPPESPGAPSSGCDCHAASAGPWGALVAVAGACLAFVRRRRR